jgi:hypothetical protein
MNLVLTSRHQAVFQQPEPVAEAWRQVDAWLGAAVAWIPEETDRHGKILGALRSCPHEG